MSVLINIGGVSRSGKSSLAAWLQEHLPNALCLHQDDFVKPTDQIPKIKDQINWEHPDSMDWAKWNQTVASELFKQNYLITEGIFAFHPSESLKTADINIYLSIDKITFLERRAKEERWGKEPEWFINYVWEAHFKYGLPQKNYDTLHLQNPSLDDYSLILQKIISI